MKTNSQERVVKELLKILSELNLERKKGIHEPYFNKKESVYVQKSVNSTYVSTVGVFIKKFENEVKKFTNSKYAVATVNGTSALHISMMTLGIGPNHEVLIPNLNYIGSSNAAIYCGASPHFVDVDSKYLGIDTNKLRDYLKRNTFKKKNQTFNKKTLKKITAIAPTHIFGQPSKMNEILDISKEFNLKIVEDAAESLGSFYKHKHTGTIGDVGILSFNGNKIITTGGGGMILTNNFKIYNQAKMLSQVSKKPHPWKYDYRGLGFNYRMPNINAALGYAQIKKLKNLLKAKKKLYSKYESKFKNHKDFYLLKELPDTKCNNWLITIILKKKNKNLLNKIFKSTNKNGFNTRPVWQLLSQVPHLKKYPKMDLSNSINLSKAIVCLPSSVRL